MNKTAFAKGNQLFRENELEAAIREYKKSLKQEENYFVYENMGMAFERLNQESDAKNAYENTLRLNSQSIRAAHYLKKIIKPSTPKKEIKVKVSPKDVHPVELIKQASAEINIEKLKKKYFEEGLDRVEDTFCLVRIIGNDLYPRHKKGQSRENIKFILENEPAYTGLEKLWIVNRIVDEGERKSIIELLKKHDQEFVEIEFLLDDYRKVYYDTESYITPWFLNTEEYFNLDEVTRGRVITAAYRKKNNYVMNNNGARNVALREAKRRAKWALPWDGNCYLTPDAWSELSSDVKRAPWFSHFVVPMARMVSNDDLINNSTPPDPVEEPQIIFRNDTSEIFNEKFCYGRRPKVELFWTLNIPGKWDRWKDEPWDQERRIVSSEANQFGLAGWVARLFSGMGGLEKDSHESFVNRGLVRQEAIISTLRHIDKNIAKVKEKSINLQFINVGALNNIRYKFDRKSDQVILNYVNGIVEDAEEALSRGPYSVIDKATLPPSGIAQDYWHPAPYWWPDPSKRDGLPYIRRDGERIPGTRMYEPESDKYDRTRIQRVFDDSTALVLAWHFTGKEEYARHAYDIFCRFFIDPSTRMNPHLNYAQVRMGRNKNIGASTGIIELKDFYYYLDIIRLLKQAKVHEEAVYDSFHSWLVAYQKWLVESVQGKKEILGHNNHGTYYDLHLAAVSAYLGDENLLNETFIRAQGRIAQQITPDGQQPDELSRTTSQHYCHYNLQGFINLASLAKNWGVDLFNFEASNGASLKAATEWLIDKVDKEWPYQQIDSFDSDRIYPIYFGSKEFGIKVNPEYDKKLLTLKSRFFPHDGIMPYWNLTFYGRKDNRIIVDPEIKTMV